ncbi:MAG: hypothetical protein ACR2OB_13305 [Solirubrobacteraceae bacterium]
MNVSAVEGQPFSGRVLTTDCAVSSASIDWGDGTPASAGRAAGLPPGALGDHTYAEEGVYTGTVRYAKAAGPVSCSRFLVQQFKASVSDGPLSATGENLTGAQRQALSGRVAHFSDGDPAGTAGDFSAQVQWGDSTTTAGTITPAGRGGFDVTGTHTYLTAGSFPVRTQITDLGGSSTTASTTARLVAAPSPLLPPFNFNLAIPQAVFGFSPLHPCQSQYVSFDASGSTGGTSSTGPLPITQYRWSFDESAFAPTVLLTTTSSLSHAFRPSSYGPGPYEGTAPNPRGDHFDYRFFRPPAMVTLEVTDSAGKTAWVTRRITFRDPVRVVPEIVPIDPQTGLPDFSRPHINRNDPRLRHAIPCAKLPLFKLAPSAKLKLGRISLRAAYGNVRRSGATITVKGPCASGLVNCFGELIVIPGPQARGHIPGNPIRGSLGHTTFFAPAGRTATVIVRLNARGAALARAHRLRSVILVLRSFGTNGKLVTSSRAVRLRLR